MRIDENTEADTKSSGINSAYTSGDDTIDQFVHRKTETTINKDLISEFTDSSNNKPKYKKHNFPQLIGAIILIIAIVLGSVVVALDFKGRGVKAGEEYYKTLSTEIVDTDEVADDGKLKKYQALYTINNDMLGYIKLPTSDYGYPVVSQKTKHSKDMGFYTKTLFSLKSNKLGTVYTPSSIGDTLPSLCILHGSADGGMFGSLNNYLQEDFLIENPIIEFDTLYKEGKWAVFSAFSYKGEEPFLIERHSFLSDQLFFKYILSYYDNSAYKIDVDANASDNILVLVGTKGNKKTVVAARLLRDGEDENNITKRVEIKEETEKKPSKKPQDASSKTESVIETVTSNISTGKPKKAVSKVTDNHLVQTGLTTDMDKTAKVEVNNVVTMIGVIGMDKTGAKHVIKDTLGLPVEFKGIYSAEKINTIINQSVADGAEISTDNPVVLTYSLGIKDGKALVPDLIGQAKAQAE